MKKQIWNNVSLCNMVFYMVFKLLKFWSPFLHLRGCVNYLFTLTKPSPITSYKERNETVVFVINSIKFTIMNNNYCTVFIMLHLDVPFMLYHSITFCVNLYHSEQMPLYIQLNFYNSGPSRDWDLSSSWRKFWRYGVCYP